MKKKFPFGDVNIFAKMLKFSREVIVVKISLKIINFPCNFGSSIQTIKYITSTSVIFCRTRKFRLLLIGSMKKFN